MKKEQEEQEQIKKDIAKLQNMNTSLAQEVDRLVLYNSKEKFRLDQLKERFKRLYGEENPDMSVQESEKKLREILVQAVEEKKTIQNSISLVQMNIHQIENAKRKTKLSLTSSA